jgi:hypothetical protein
VVLEKKLRRVLVGSHQFSVSNFILNRIPLYRPKVGVGVEKGFSLLSSHVSFRPFILPSFDVGDAIMKAKNKRVSMDSHQSRPTNVEAKAKLKYQNLLQEYLELQKVSLFYLNNYIL